MGRSGDISGTLAIYHLSNVTTPTLLAVGDNEGGILHLYTIEPSRVYAIWVVMLRCSNVQDKVTALREPRFETIGNVWMKFSIRISRPARHIRIDVSAAAQADFELETIQFEGA